MSWYKLYLGDCLEYMRGMETGSFYTVVTDPPYGLINKFGENDLYGRRMQFSFDNDTVPVMVATALDIALALGANSFHVFCDPEHFGAIAKSARKNGFVPKPWAKIKLCPPPPMPGNWWPSSFELAIYGYRQGAYFGDSSAKRSNAMIFDSYRFGIRSEEKVDHPTQKWLPMIRYLVNTLCPIDGTVFDPFMGSGTTGVACMQLGRNFIGCEIDPKYYAIAEKRISEASAQLTMF